MIVIHKRSGRLRISRNVDSKYEDVARSLRRLQIQPVGENIASVELNNGVVGVAGADMVHIPLVKGATTTRKSTDMSNTMRITIPWKPGMAVMLKDGHSAPDESVVQFLAEQGVNLERIAGGFMVAPRTLPYTTRPRPESIQKEPFKLWKGLGPDTNRKEH